MNNYVLREGIIVISNAEGRFVFDMFNRKRLLLNDSAYRIITAIKQKEDIPEEYKDFLEMLEEKGFLTNQGMNTKIETLCKEAGL